MEISNVRKTYLSLLAEFIANEYNTGLYVEPKVIAKNNGITCVKSDYATYFDGMLEHDSGNFCIYINDHSEYDLTTPRLRFSFAHELGHYFIDEHRNALMKGVSLHHQSFYKLSQKNLIELEADYFAANLLMPTNSFLSCIDRKPFSYNLINDLTRNFGTSLSATLLRFVEIGNHPIMVVYAKNNIIQYHWASVDFPYKFLNTDSGKRLPPYTVAGDFFNANEMSNDVEIIDANEWFRSYQDIRSVKLFEKCIYMSKSNTTVSIIWGK